MCRRRLGPHRGERGQLRWRASRASGGRAAHGGARTYARRQGGGRDLRAASAAHFAARRRAQAADAAASQIAVAGADPRRRRAGPAFYSRSLDDDGARFRPAGAGGDASCPRGARRLQLSLRPQGARATCNTLGALRRRDGVSRRSFIRSKCCADITFPAARSAS